MKKIKQGIVITTSEPTKAFLPDCLASLERVADSYPVVVVGNQTRGDLVNITNDWNGYELGGILHGAELFDEFLHLMDTCVLTDDEMVHEMFSHDGGVYLCRGFFSYLGKYDSGAVRRVGIPKIETKDEAIRAEWEWNGKYLGADHKAIQFQPPLPVITEVFEMRHGRQNMVLDNGFIKKYKARWK